MEAYLEHLLILKWSYIPVNNSLTCSIRPASSWPRDSLSWGESWLLCVTDLHKYEVVPTEYWVHEACIDKDRYWHKISISDIRLYNQLYKWWIYKQMHLFVGNVLGKMTIDLRFNWFHTKYLRLWLLHHRLVLQEYYVVYLLHWAYCAFYNCKKSGWFFIWLIGNLCCSI